MAPRKTASAGSTSASQSTPAPVLETPLDGGAVAKPALSARTDLDGSTSSLATDPLPAVKVNSANLGEIKSALDDIVKKHLLEQSFTPSLLHPTVHLSLGYSSVILALSSVVYSLRVSFEDSKQVLWIAVIGYGVLQSALWAWKKWVEKGEVFKGRRRRMVKRIETDHVQLISSTTLDAPPTPQTTFSPHTRPSSPSNPTSPIDAQPTPLSPVSRNAPSASSPASASGSPAKGQGPSYLLNLNLSTTSNNGKSLIHKSRTVAGKMVGEFVDEEGGVEEGEVIRWLAGILAEAGLVGAEEEGAKVE
ncbi:hypothetical protein IAU60_006396 [Kwoniella sp. DSM 27419]